MDQTDQTKMDRYERQLVKSLSRSFALSLLFLPRAQRSTVSRTYMLARYADTLADCGNWNTQERLAQLERWENAILHMDVPYKSPQFITSFRPIERDFLEAGPKLLRLFSGVTTQNQAHSIEVLRTLIGAMKWDLKTFSGETRVYGVKDTASFDWYCTSIAGCVGPYWTRVFELPSNLEILAEAYGRGLQRINILRDVVEDWNRGRVYLPQNLLESFGLAHEKPWTQPRWKDFVVRYVDETSAMLRYGAHFVDSIPKSKWRLRWASVMPLLIGSATLDLIRNASEWEAPIKISRKDVRRLSVQAALRVFRGANFTSLFTLLVAQKSLDRSA